MAQVSDAVRKWSQYQTIYKKSNMVASWYNGYGMLDMPPEIPLSVRYEDFKARLSEAFNRPKVEGDPNE